MDSLTITFLTVLVTVMTAGGQAAPVSGYNSSPENSTDEANIAVLQTEAKAEIISVIQEISLLEIHTVSYHSCSLQKNDGFQSSCVASYSFS